MIKLFHRFLYEDYFQTIPGIETGTILEKDNEIIAVIEPTRMQIKRKSAHT